MSEMPDDFGGVWWSTYPPGEAARPKGLRRWWLRLTDRFRRDREWPVAPESDGRGALLVEAHMADLAAFYGKTPPFATWWDPKPKPTEEWVWCSFTDPARPQGERFLGVVVTTAAKWAMGLGLWDLNPGGEMAMVPIPADKLHKVPPEYRDRILTRAEAESL